MRISLQPAYVLHSQAFSNSSLLIDIFTREYGRFRAVAKGVRSAKSAKRALLQLFTPVLLSWSGKSELKNLCDIELNRDVPVTRLHGNALFNGMYVNELLLKMTYSNDPQQAIFDLYQYSLHQLAATIDNQEFYLRMFEYELLEHLGYSLGAHDLDMLCQSSQWYAYHPEQGLQASSKQLTGKPLVQGHFLYQLLQGEPCCEKGLSQLKQLMRFVLHHHLDGKKIESRVLYQ